MTVVNSEEPVSETHPHAVSCERCKAEIGRKCCIRLPDGRVLLLDRPHVERVRAAQRATERQLPPRWAVRETTPTKKAAPRPKLEIPMGYQPATREEVRSVDCPNCDAEAGRPCWGRVRRYGGRQPVKGHCWQRFNAAMAALGRPTRKQLLAQQQN